MLTQKLIKNGIQMLKPERETVIINGKLFYSESESCWNKIRLKRDILTEYPQLKSKTGNYGYTMILPKNTEDFKKATEGVNEGSIPILLFFNVRGRSD